jgi:DNA repair ATPase RecN
MNDLKDNSGLNRIHTRIDNLDHQVEELEKLALRESHNHNLLENRVLLLEERLKDAAAAAKTKFTQLEADVSPVKKQVAFAEVMVKAAGLIAAIGVILKFFKLI